MQSCKQAFLHNLVNTFLSCMYKFVGSSMTASKPWMTLKLVMSVFCVFFYVFIVMCQFLFIYDVASDLSKFWPCGPLSLFKAMCTKTP